MLTDQRLLFVDGIAQMRVTALPLESVLDATCHRSLAGRAVRLTFDRERRDRYGRLLAFVDVGGRRFNDELLTGGYARLLVIPPNGLHGRAMLDEELAARSAGRGLWGACPEVAGK